LHLPYSFIKEKKEEINVRKKEGKRRKNITHEITTIIGQNTHCYSCGGSQAKLTCSSVCKGTSETV